MVKKVTLVNERFTAPSIAIYIMLMTFVISLFFLALGYTPNDIITLMGVTAFTYFGVSFGGSPTILGIILGI